MTMTMTKHLPANAFTRVFHPTQGRYTLELLNLLLRLTVKSRLGLHIDIPKLRGKFSQLNRQASPALLAGVKRENVLCNGVSAQWLSPEATGLIECCSTSMVGLSWPTRPTSTPPWCHPGARA